METVALELTVILTTIDDQVLPDQTRLVEHFMDYVYQYHNKAGALVQSVQVTAIDGGQVS